MARGQSAKPGDTRVSPNGYHYTRTEKGWRLTHHIIAEQKLGRPIAEGERVKFGARGKTDLSPENVEVVRVGQKTTRTRLAQVEARLDELIAERDRLAAEL